MKKDTTMPPDLSAKPETESLKRGRVAVDRLYQQIHEQMSSPPTEGEIQKLCEFLNGILRRAEELLFAIVPRD